MGCRQDLNICNSQQQEIGLAASPNMYYVIVYPVRNACRVDPQWVYKHESCADSPPSLLNKRLQYEKSPLFQSALTSLSVYCYVCCYFLLLQWHRVGLAQSVACLPLAR